MTEAAGERRDGKVMTEKNRKDDNFIPEPTAKEERGQEAAGASGKAEGQSAERPDLVLVVRPLGEGGEANASAASFGESAENTEKAESAEKRAERRVGKRVPMHATVVDKRGEKIGYIREGTLYDGFGNVQGEFGLSQGVVTLYYGQAKKGYVDRNDNILSTSDEYIATIRYPRRKIFAVILCALAIAALITGVATFTALRKSEPYAPTIFVCDSSKAEWEQDKDIGVFYNQKFGDRIIEPGQKGAYRFYLENRSRDAVSYDLTFTCENEYGIHLKYRLLRDGAYLSGSEGGYLFAEELVFDELTIEANSSSLFVLEWYWEDDDEVDTIAGENGAVYTLHIEFNARVIGLDGSDSADSTEE